MRLTSILLYFVILLNFAVSCDDDDDSNNSNNTNNVNNINNINNTNNLNNVNNTNNINNVNNVNNTNTTNNTNNVNNTNTTNNNPGDFAIESTSWDNDGTIPTVYTCTYNGGSNTSPQLQWSQIPLGTTSFAIIMDDEVSPCGTGLDACRHWNIFNIPSTEDTFVENVDLSGVAGVVQPAAYDGTNGYAGPCPPTAHIYNLTIYALGSSMPALTINDGHSRLSFATDFSTHILGSATLTGTFTP
jgi:Raf kinase inhibitor-like YbhB/YbcL family protein